MVRYPTPGIHPGKDEPMTFRIGVIGAGTHGARYLRHALVDVAGLTATALCRRNPEAGAKLAEELGLRYHRDPLALIADPEVDGVVIATPPASHGQLAEAVLGAGKPLLLEKPLTATLQEAEHLEDLDARSAAPLFLAQTLRWNPVIKAVKDLWPRLGKVHLIRLSQRLEPTTLAWQHDPHDPTGGSLLITGVHVIDTVRFLTGREFASVTAWTGQILNHAVEDAFLARAVLGDGCWVSLEVSKYTRSRACWLDVVGEDGQLLADYLKGGVTLRRDGGEEHLDVPAAVPTLPLVLGDWLRTVRDGAPPPVTVTDGVAVMQVVDACYRSARTGRAVEI